MCFFFFNDTATTEIYTLSLHDALPISQGSCYRPSACRTSFATRRALTIAPWTVAFWPSDWVRSEEHSLNSSHQIIAYAVFCFEKKNDPTDRNHSFTPDAAPALQSVSVG